MNWDVGNPKARLYLIAGLIVLVGLGSAALIYLRAQNDSDSAVGYEILDGQAYPMRPEDSKVYRHDLELYGGTVNVLAVEITQWFTGLWHGKSLAFTIAGITLLISSGFFFVARLLPSDFNTDARDENPRAGRK